LLQRDQRNPDGFIAFLHRHVIPMAFIFKKDSVVAPYVITTFVLSVQERWFLVTAGHCLQKIDEYKGNGYTLSECYLIDSFGTGATHFEPIPFTYELARPQYVTDDREFDFGIIPLLELHRGSLSANNIIPLNEDVWRIQPKEPEFFALLGVPTGNLKMVENKVGFVAALNWIEECEKPDSLPDTEIPLFYGKITLHAAQKSVVGMSGGPIFAFKEVDGQYRYWLKALQSRWIEQSNLIIGCPTIHLGSVLDKMLVEGSL
jgi:hypothetical protein